MNRSVQEIGAATPSVSTTKTNASFLEYDSTKWKCIVAVVGLSVALVLAPELHSSPGSLS